MVEGRASRGVGALRRLCVGGGGLCCTSFPPFPRYLPTARKLRLALHAFCWALAAVALAWPLAARACSCNGPGTSGMIDPHTARNLFIGDVVFTRSVSVGDRRDPIAQLVHVRAAWKRALPEYVVVWTEATSCGVFLPAGSRSLFAFAFDGHAGLDRQPESHESDPQGWAWLVRGCRSDFEIAEICDLDRFGDRYEASNRMELPKGEPPRRPVCRGPSESWATNGQLDRREREIIAGLTKAIGPPLRPAYSAKAADFESFAIAHVGEAGLPPWPADWEYAVAVAFELARLLGADHSTELLLGNSRHLYTLELWDWVDPLEALLRSAQAVADATMLPRPTLVWKTLGDGLYRLFGDLEHMQTYPGADLTSPRFVQHRRILSARKLLQLPRNWRDAPGGMVESWDIELFNDCRRAVSPSAQCLWINSLIQRHQRALNGLSMAYLRHVLDQARVPWIDGRPSVPAD